MALSGRFEEALVYAARLHRNQRRKGSGTPYIGHLLSVASLVLEYGGGEDEAIGALLHDAVEDQGGYKRLEEIRNVFGEKVATIVSGCSDSFTLFKPPWRQRKEEYLRHLPEANESTRLVSCADKLHNVRSIVKDLRIMGDGVWSRFHGGKDGSLWYYSEMVKEFLDRGPRPLAEELARTFAELEKLALEESG
jgi:(p)ppGpp synthase/HD superfamily hydrolase